MKKSLLLSPLLFIFLIGCNKSSIEMPKSPFNDDKYERIGLTSAYKGEIKPLLVSDYNLLKQETMLEEYTKSSKDKKVSRYIVETETRDLKYAYFGKENSSISMCMMDSSRSEGNRYNNLVTVVKEQNKNIKQTAQGNIIADSATDTYTFSPEKNNYQINIKKTYNDKTEKTTIAQEKTSYDDEVKIFCLKPYERITDAYFKSDFKFLGDNAVYGSITINNKEKLIVREAKSVFDYYQTAVGRKYKCCNNSFYEALLEKYNNSVRFTNFRFYREKLILSEAIDDTGIPVLYLAKPVLVEFTETKYTMEYNSFTEYQGDIPKPTL